MLTKKSALLALTLLLVSLYATTQLAAAYGDASVNVINTEFQPTTVTIQAGDTVTWTNTDGFHNVRADDDSFMNTPSQGWTFSHTFTTPGTYEYYCEIHSDPQGVPGEDMNGVVVVELPTAVTLTDLGVSSGTAWMVGVAGAAILMAVGVAVAWRRKQAQV